MGNKIMGDLFPANWNRVTTENTTLKKGSQNLTAV